MGTLHNELRYAVELQRAYRIAFGEAGSWGLERGGETLQPHVDLWSLPEWARLRHEELASRTVLRAAGAAGTLAVVLIRVPTDLLVVVEAIHVVGAVAGDVITIGLMSNAAAQTVTDGATRDSRWNRSSFLSQVRLESGVPVGGLTPNQLEQLVLDSTVQADSRVVPIIVRGGHQLVVEQSNDAAAMRVTFKWRSRRAYPGELE